ncbi:helix-turn-helix domain-containing protein [Embleya sp. NPDC005575]|uniref:telomere-associated protein Tap n=1 Tax=Embleya sp. NPDC005575 TaxID=3156892 RepID=UPI0033B6ED22
MSDSLFDAVDALLAQAQSDLPPPAERTRLRKAGGFTQQQVADALGVTRVTIVGWEAGRTEPRPPQRPAYARLLEGLAERYPTLDPAADTAGTGTVTVEPTRIEPAVDEPGPTAPEPQAQPAAPAPDPTTASTTTTPIAEPVVTAAAPWTRTPTTPPAAPAAAPKSTPTPSRAASVDRRAPAGTTSPSGPARAAAKTEDVDAKPARFPAGPLAVLDVDTDTTTLLAHLADGTVLPCPAKSLLTVVSWALDAGLGAERLHRAGRDADPLVVVTAAAAERLRLPAELDDRKHLRLTESHPVVKQLLKPGWKLTKRGFGSWTKVYKPVDGGRRQCVQFAFLGWDALDTRSWADAATLPAPELAALLGAYATRVVTPRGSTAAAGLALMTELRPPTQAVKDETTGTWRSGPVAGSLLEAVDPAPPEAVSEHPIAQDRDERDVMVEEAYVWSRELHAVTDPEGEAPYAIGLDVNAAFLAAASRLPVGIGAPVHVTGPRFDPKMPGCWYVDLSDVRVDPRLPSPFTPNGIAPTGPGWYATPTVAYAAELGATVQPFEAWIRPENGPYLDPWYTRLREAYMTTMSRLGVTPDLTDQAFLDAMAGHKQIDPAEAIVLAAIKATVKGGIGKLRERPQGAAHHGRGERWAALERPTWRPDIRAAVISTARVGMHRKMRKFAAATGLYPLGILSDCVVYASPGPSPLDLLPPTVPGQPVKTGFRLGAGPGLVKHEGTQTMEWVLQGLANNPPVNPARHIKDGVDAVAEGE